MTETKVTYVNGLALQGQIDVSRNLVVDFGSEEIKILVRNKQNGLFEDYNEKAHKTYKDEAGAIISALDIEGVTVSKEKMNAKIAEQFVGDDAFFDEVAGKLEEFGISVYTTGVWREIEHSAVTNLSLKEELELTARSASIDNSDANILINGSMQYTIEAYGLDDKFVLNSVHTILANMLLLRDFEEKDHTKNNANFGRLLATLVKVANLEYGDGDKVYVISDTSSLGIVVKHEDDFKTIIGIEENMASSLVLEEFNEVINKNYDNATAKKTFQTLASVMLTMIQMDSDPNVDSEEIKGNMRKELEKFISDSPSLAKESGKILKLIKGDQSVCFTRNIECDEYTLKKYAANLLADEYSNNHPVIEGG